MQRVVGRGGDGQKGTGRSPAPRPGWGLSLSVAWGNRPQPTGKTQRNFPQTLMKLTFPESCSFLECMLNSSVMSNSFATPWTVTHQAHGISQLRILERVVIPFSKGSSQPRDRTVVSCIGRLIVLSPRGSSPAPVYPLTMVLKPRTHLDPRLWPRMVASEPPLPKSSLDEVTC